MKREQIIVGIGSASGIIGMILLNIFLYNVLPNLDYISGNADRLAFTLKCNVLAIIPYFIMLVVIGNSRFLSQAIDPTKHAETNSQEINGRVADNTLQQLFIFVISTLALSTVISGEDMKIILALTITFIISRIIFWIGYRINPLYRAPGMSSTAYMNLFIIAYIGYTFFF